MRRFEEVEDRFKKFPDEETHLPKRATAGSAGYDMYSKEYKELAPGEHYTFVTDVCVLMFQDNVLQIYPRSGNGVKRGIKIRNSTGIIDPDFYHNENNGGNIAVCLENTGDETFIVRPGDRIAQGVFTRFYIVDGDEMASNSEDNKRKGGYGSTGR